MGMMSISWGITPIPVPIGLIPILLIPISNRDRWPVDHRSAISRLVNGAWGNHANRP